MRPKTLRLQLLYLMAVTSGIAAYDTVSRSKSVWKMGCLVTEDSLPPDTLTRVLISSHTIKVSIKCYTSCDAYFSFTTSSRLLSASPPVAER
jgi:hypothetical protein